MTTTLPQILALSCCLLAAPLNASAQKGHKKTPPPVPAKAPEVKPQRSAMSFEEYDHLLNILFPIDHSSPLGLEYTIVFRFEPNLHPESQVTLRHWHDGHFEVTYEQVLEGNAWRVASGRRVPDQSLDLPAIAKDVPIRRYRVAATNVQVEGWHKELFPTLATEFARERRLDKEVRKTGTRDVVSNGTRYELWYIQGDDETHAIAWDSEVGPLPTGEYALAKWANTVRTYASSHLLGPLQSKPAQPATPVPAAKGQ